MRGRCFFRNFLHELIPSAPIYKNGPAQFAAQLEERLPTFGDRTTVGVARYAVDSSASVVAYRTILFFRAPQLGRAPLGGPHGGLVKSESIVDKPEPKLLEVIFNDYFLSRSLGVPPLASGRCRHRLGVLPQDLQLASSAFGDLDALLLVENDAASPRAIQFKRIKVKPDAFATGLPNGLQGLSKGVEQANALAAVGFAVVWLSVLVVVDAREIVSQSNHFVRNVYPLVELVKASLPLSEFDPTIGASVLDIVQTVDLPVTESGFHGGHMLRAATVRNQPASLTSAVAKLFAEMWTA